MLSCSTHGRVASALRTRVGQPTAQVIPGTRKQTSLAEFVMNNIPFKSLLPHCLQHILGRDLIQVESDMETVCWIIEFQAHDTRKP